MIANCFNCCIPDDLYKYFSGRQEKAEITGRLNQAKRDFLMRQNQEHEQPRFPADDRREIRYGEVCDILIDCGYYPSPRPIRWGDEVKWESGWNKTKDGSGYSGTLYDTPLEALHESIIDIIKNLEEDERS